MTLIGGLLRGYRIAGKSLWIDEAFSVWMARQPIPELCSWLVHIDQHPPLYYLLLHFWIQVGDALGWLVTPEGNTSWVRALSALASTLNLPVLYAIGERLVGRKGGLVAAGVLALAPFHVYLAQEARMYALLCLNISLALLALVRWMTRPPSRPFPAKPAEGGTQPPSRPDRVWSATGGNAISMAHVERMWWRSLVPPLWNGGGLGRGPRPIWAAYILFTAAALWTHNTALLFWASVNLAVFGLMLLERTQTGHQGQKRLSRLNAPSLQAWMLAQAGVLLLWSPWIAPFVRQATGIYREFWLPAPTWSSLTGAIQNLMSAFLPATAVDTALLWSLYVVAILAGICRLRRRPAVPALLATLFATPFAGELLVSLRRPIFYDRTLIWASLPLYLLLSMGIVLGLSSARPKSGRAASRTLAALGLLAALNVLSLREYYVQFQKEQWDDAAQYVARHVRDRDLILYHASWAQLPFDFYFDTDRSVTEHGLPVDLFARDVLEPKMQESDLHTLHEFIRGRDRVWLVYSHDWYTDPRGLIPAALDQEGHLLDRQPFHGLEVRLYDLP